MGHMGDPAAVTPNLDHLVATDAVSFRIAACQNTVCTPSRCSFMTGWYPHVRGHRTMHYMLRDREGEPNLLRVLRDNGYFVWWGGKNDLVPGQNGLTSTGDELISFGICNSNPHSQVIWQCLLRPCGRGNIHVKAFINKGAQSGNKGCPGLWHFI